MTSSHFNDYSLGGKTTQAAAFPRMPKPENGGDFSTRYGGSSQFSSENKRPSACQIFRTVRVRQAQRQHQEFPWIVCTKNREKHPVAFHRFSCDFSRSVVFFFFYGCTESPNRWNADINLQAKIISNRARWGAKCQRNIPHQKITMTTWPLWISIESFCELLTALALSFEDWCSLMGNEFMDFRAFYLNI